MFQLSRQLSEWVIILTDASALHRTEHRWCNHVLVHVTGTRPLQMRRIRWHHCRTIGGSRYIYMCQRSMVVGVGAGLACEITLKTGERPGCRGLYFRTDKD